MLETCHHLSILWTYSYFCSTHLSSTGLMQSAFTYSDQTSISLFIFRSETLQPKEKASCDKSGGPNADWIKMYANRTAVHGVLTRTENGFKTDHPGWLWTVILFWPVHSLDETRDNNSLEMTICSSMRHVLVQFVVRDWKSRRFQIKSPSVSSSALR